MLPKLNFLQNVSTNKTEKSLEPKCRWTDLSSILKYHQNWNWRGGRGLALSLECRLISAPRPPMHFCHKTFPGTSNNIYYFPKFQGSGCLISWLPKFTSFGLANWLSTFFQSKLSFAQLKPLQFKNCLPGWHIPNWYVRHVSGVPDTSLLSLAYPWCPR